VTLWLWDGSAPVLTCVCLVRVSAEPITAITYDITRWLVVTGAADGAVVLHKVVPDPVGQPMDHPPPSHAPPRKTSPSDSPSSKPTVWVMGSQHVLSDVGRTGGGGSTSTSSSSSSGIAEVRWRPDGRVVMVAGWDGRIRCYGAKRPHRLLAVLTYHRGQVTAVACSDDSKLLASAGRDHAVALWDVLQPKGA
jgi:WD40 repeat protein